jgi:hypothetical protein
MPKVGNKHYPYTKAGMAAAKKAREKKPKPIRGSLGMPSKIGRPRTNKERGSIGMPSKIGRPRTNKPRGSLGMPSKKRGYDK